MKQFEYGMVNKNTADSIIRHRAVETLNILRKNLGPGMLQRIESLPYRHGYYTEEQKKELISRILGKMLDYSTPMRSYSENMIKTTFMEESVPVLYKPFVLPIRETNHSNKNVLDICTPDFMLPYHYINGKGIIFESHSSDQINKRYLKRINSVRKTYGLYIVLATNPINKFTGMSAKSIAGYVDELWDIPVTQDGKHRAITDRVRDLLRRTDISTYTVVEDLLGKLSV